MPFAKAEENLALSRADTWLADITEDRYLELLDWTGWEIRAEKRGHIPDALSPVLKRLELDVDAWAENVVRYGSLFRRLAGKVSRLRDWARAKHLAWLHGHRGARLLYCEVS